MTNKAHDLAFLSEGGAMADLIAAHDWSASLGPVSGWPTSLKTTVGLMLHSPVPLVLLWGADGIMIYNQAYAGFAGNRHPSLLGSKVLEGWPEAADLNAHVMATCMGGGTLEYKDERLVLNRRGQPEEGWMDLFYSPVIDESGKPGGVIAVVVETTERVLSRRNAAESEERLQLALSAGHGIGTWNWDVQKDRVVADPRFARLYGVDPKMARAGAPIADFFSGIHPDDVPRVQAGVQETIKTGEDFSEEYRLVQPDGSVRWVAAQGRCSLAADGTPLHFPGVSFDITDRKEAEVVLRQNEAQLEQRVAERTRELEQAQDALRQAQKMEAVGQLTGGIAHDFNNLLQGITGALDRVQHRIQAGRANEAERFLKAALDSANRAAALTHRLLAFSRRQTLDPRPTDTNRLIGGMEELIVRTMGPNVAVEVVGAAGLWPVRVDPSQLENSLLNLCINARDAMPEGGKVTIETANKWLDDRAAREREIPPGQYVSLCVTDTGTGMTPEVIARAFDPFFTTKPMGRGTGLGLSMIYGFVRQSGGQIRIYSEVSKGTTMCLYFPRHIGAVEEQSQPENQYVERGFGETVLVVDDEPTVRMLISEVLGESFYNILEAGDGPSALKILETAQRIDLMITDVGLPGGMNGRQVADAARVLRKDLKVLFITGYAENAAVGNGHLERGMEILAKPFAMSTLAGKVREMIES